MYISFIISNDTYNYFAVECPGEGQFFTIDCFPFNATCANPNPPSLCDAPRCVCPMGQVLNEENRTCVDITDCRKFSL